MENRIINKRIKFLLFLIFLFFTTVIARAVQIQIVKNSYFKEKAENQQISKENIPAPRGRIFDRHKNLLADDRAEIIINLDFFRLMINPNLPEDEKNKEIINQKREILNVLKDSLKLVSKKECNSILKSSKKFYPKFRSADISILTEYEDLIAKYPAICIEKSYRRFYPYGEAASSLLGITAKKREGIYGIEKEFNNYLKGKNGYKYVKRVGINKIKSDPVLLKLSKKPETGHDVELTIDIDLQIILEKELEKTINEFHAQDGFVIAANPKNGEILGMASFPTHNLNNITEINDALVNKGISHSFEPGSIFKLIAAACALEENLISPKDTFHVQNGRWRYNSKLLCKDSHIYEDEETIFTFREVIENSSNIGTFKAALIAGKSKIYEYTNKFGFGEQTALRLPNEVSGKIYKLSKNEDLYQFSIGQGIGVSGIQMIAAYSAVLSEGELRVPKIVRNIHLNNGQIIKQENPEFRKILKKSTCDTLKDFLRGVVEDGTAQNVKIKNFSIGGKTGTAQRYDNKMNKYNGWHASFIGFLPVENPKLLILVTITDPQKKSHFGSTVAGSCFRNIVARIQNSALPYIKENFIKVKHIEPKKLFSEEENKFVKTELNKEKNFIMPDLKDYSIANAYKELSKYTDNITVVDFRKGFILSQDPSPGTLCTNDCLIILNSVSPENNSAKK